MLFSRTPSNNASPIKSPTKSVCRVKISYNSLHTIIGNKTSIDFHFFRDLFDISLAKDRDRNPTVLQVDIKNEREVFISKNSFTTPVLIRFSNEDTWKSLLVSDSFELKNIAFAKVDKYEIKIEKVVVQVPALESKPTKILNSPSSTGTPVRLNMNERSFMQTPKTFSGTPIDDTKKKGEMRNSNLWDYFGKVLDSGKKSVVNKPVPQNQLKSQNYRTPEIEQNTVFDDDDECSVKAILKRMAQKSEDEKKILLEKRQIGPSLSDVENEIEADGGLHRKRLKFQHDSEDENNEDCELPTADSDHLPNKTPAFMVESSQIVLGSKRNKNRIIQLLGEEEEEKRALPAARNERMIFGGFNQKNENNYAMNMKNRIEEEKTFCSDDLKSTANKSTPIKSPTKHTTCSPHARRSLETEKSIKLKRLKKIVDDRRETLNKGSVTKEPIKSQEKEPQANKETCPICLGDIVKEVGCLSDCIHKFCFDCIKDWSDVTNECPLCKRKFNEITKYLLKEGGESVKLETLPVEDKKQRVHDDGNEVYVEEDVDECCYECRGDEDLNILLICDACGFYCCHTYCCNPPLDFIPEEDWFCKYCVQQHTRSTRRRNATRNNNRAQPREEVPVEPRGPTRRVTRSRAQRRETLLESLFEAAEQEDLDNELANLDLYQESYFGDGGDLEDNSNTFDSTSIGTRSNNRRLNRRQNTNSREMPAAEERPQRRTRRNNREEVADFTTDLTDINDLINLENYYFNNQAPAATQRTQQQPRTSRSNTRMIIEERNMSPAMSMDDLNQFRYPLRSQGRSNY